MKLTKALNKHFNPYEKEMHNKKDNFVSAVIVCAGNSTRMGLDKSKQFIDLLGNPAVYYTLLAFDNSVSVKEVVIVCRECDKNDFQSIVAKYGFTKVVAIVNGGETRSLSVKNGIMATSDNSTHIAIHDGARCLITTNEIEKVVLSAMVTGASALGVMVKDTIKIVNDNNIIEDTPNRSTLRAIQTPQVFSKDKYIKFSDNAKDDAVDFTDDCKLFEHFGEKVTVVDGLYTNIKLTTQDDIIMAESILKGRN